MTLLGPVRMTDGGDVSASTLVPAEPALDSVLDSIDRTKSGGASLSFTSRNMVETIVLHFGLVLFSVALGMIYLLGGEEPVPTALWAVWAVGVVIAVVTAFLARAAYRQQHTYARTDRWDTVTGCLADRHRRVRHDLDRRCLECPVAAGGGRFRLPRDGDGLPRRMGHGRPPRRASGGRLSIAAEGTLQGLGSSTLDPACRLHGRPARGVPGRARCEPVALRHRGRKRMGPGPARRPGAAALRGADAASQGDLTTRVELVDLDDSENEFGFERTQYIVALSQSFDHTLESLRGLVSRVRVGGEQIGVSASQVLVAAREQAAAASEQSSAVAETSATIEELAATAAQIAETAEQVALFATETLGFAEQGRVGGVGVGGVDGSDCCLGWIRLRLGRWGWGRRVRRLVGFCR